MKAMTVLEELTSRDGRELFDYSTLFGGLTLNRWKVVKESRGVAITLGAMT